MTSFTPINLNLYVAAYSGAVAGMATGGWITDGNPSDYALVTSIAGAYAQEFDRVWDNPTLLNSLEQACITSIISDNFEGRAPGPLNNPKFLMGSNWTISVSACIALVLESDTFFADQGITPPSPQLLPAPGPLGNLLTSDGTEWVSEPPLLPDPGPIGNVLTSDGTEWVSEPPISGGGQAVITLVNGLNSNVSLPGNPVIKIAGPTGPFSVDGFSAPDSGEGNAQRVLFINVSGEPITIVACDPNPGVLANPSASAASNQICTMSGVPISPVNELSGGSTVQGSVFELTYDTTLSKWIVTNMGTVRPFQLNAADFGIPLRTNAVPVTDAGPGLTLLAETVQELSVFLSPFFENASCLEVFFPPGLYYTSVPFQLVNVTGVILRGSGVRQTSFALHMPQAVGAYVYGAIDLVNCKYCSVRDISFTGHPFGFILANAASVGDETLTITNDFGLSEVLAETASGLSPAAIMRADYSYGEIINVPTGFAGGVHIPLTTGLKRSYAPGDLVLHVALSLLSIRSDQTIPSSQLSHGNSVSNVVMVPDGMPNGISITCLGGAGSSSDLNNDFHEFTGVTVEEPSGPISAVLIVGDNALGIQFSGCNLTGGSAIDASQGGSIIVSSTGLAGTGGYCLLTGRPQAHPWLLSNCFTESSCGLIKGIDVSRLQFIDVGHDHKADNFITTTSVFTGATVSVQTSNIGTIQAGDQISIDAQSGPDDGLGEHLIVSQVIPGTITPYTDTTIIFTTDPTYTYPIGSCIHSAMIDVEGSGNHLLISNSSVDFGGLPGAWIHAIDTVEVGATVISLMNFNTSIDGWVLDGAVLNLTSSMLGQPNIYLGFVNGHEKYLNGGRSYLQSNVVNAFGGTSNLLNYPYDEKLLALAAGVNNNIDVFSASGEVEVTNSAGNSTINGIVGRPGKVFRFFLRGPNTFTIANLSAGQTPGNRIQTSTNADIGPLSIPPGGFLIAVFSWKQWIDSGNGGWACVIQNVNYISSTNAATIPAANPLVFAGNAISRKGSGIFRVTATSCPFPTGAPVVITFQIFRDAVALPPIQKSSPVGPGDDSPCHQEWIDVITDFVPHVYSLQASAVSGTLSDSAGHCTITANEL